MNLILTLGYQGSGKTTMSKRLSKKLNYFHFEYDVYIEDKVPFQNFCKNKNKYNGIISDAIYYDMENINTNINWYNKVFNINNITLIYLDISKLTCSNNILKRNRFRENKQNIDLSEIDIEYDFKMLEHKAKVITINNINYNIDKLLSFIDNTPISKNSTQIINCKTWDAMI